MSVSNEALLALQKFRERVDQQRNEVVAMWKNPPPPVMLAYGAVVLTSGVLFAALGQWSALGNFVWGSGLTTLLKLTFKNGELEIREGSEKKVGDVLNEVVRVVGLSDETREELSQLFLQLVQWNVIESINLHISEVKREELAEVLMAGGTDGERSKAILDFLNEIDVGVFEAKKFLNQASEKSLLQMASVFEQCGYPGIVDKIKVMLE